MVVELDFLRKFVSRNDVLMRTLLDEYLNRVYESSELYNARKISEGSPIHEGVRYLCDFYQDQRYSGISFGEFLSSATVLIPSLLEEVTGHLTKKADFLAKNGEGLEFYRMADVDYMFKRDLRHDSLSGLLIRNR